MKTFALRLTDEEHDELAKKAEKEGRSMNTVCRRKLFGTKIKPLKGKK